MRQDKEVKPALHAEHQASLLSTKPSIWDNRWSAYPYHWKKRTLLFSPLLFTVSGMLRQLYKLERNTT